jgi:hypothetical protein
VIEGNAESILTNSQAGAEYWHTQHLDHHDVLEFVHNLVVIEKIFHAFHETI